MLISIEYVGKTSRSTPLGHVRDAKRRNVNTLNVMGLRKTDHSSSPDLGTRGFSSGPDALEDGSAFDRDTLSGNLSLSSFPFPQLLFLRSDEHD